MKRIDKKTSHLTQGLLLCLLGLISIGLIIQYSASYPIGIERFQDGFYYLRKQLLFLFVGILFMLISVKIPYRFWAKLSMPLLFLAGILLVLVFIPSTGVSAGGARRWLEAGGIRFQPSELAKLALVLFLATSMAKKRKKMQFFSIGVLPHFLIPGGLLVLILIQPDFGTFFTMGVLIVLMLFIGGARFQHLILIGLISLPFLYHLIAGVDYRRKRFLAFLDPWADSKDSGFQIIQSQIAFHKGGIMGVGLGEGQQKMLFVPDVHTDFIFSVVGEELGFIGVVILLLLFLIFTFIGFKIAMKAHRLGAYFGCYLAAGITLMVSVPAFVNMAVVLGILPTKGMVLPFLSYGGSALIILLFALGILLHLSRGKYQESFS